MGWLKLCHEISQIIQEASQCAKEIIDQFEVVPNLKWNKKNFIKGLKKNSKIG